MPFSPRPLSRANLPGKSAIFLAIFMFLGAAVPLRAADMLISTLRGNVQVLKAGDTKWKKAKPRALLKSGDKVRTDKKAQVLIIDKEGTKVLIKEKTTLQITKASLAEWDLKQEAGRVVLKVKKLATNQTFKVRTPTAVCAVRGTEFETQVAENGSTQLDVYEGTVAFNDEKESLPETLVQENQRSTIQAGSPPSEPETIPEGEKSKHEEDLNPKEEIVQDVWIELKSGSEDSEMQLDIQAE